MYEYIDAYVCAFYLLILYFFNILTLRKWRKKFKNLFWLQGFVVWHFHFIQILLWKEENLSNQTRSLNFCSLLTGNWYPDFCLHAHRFIMWSVCVWGAHICMHDYHCCSSSLKNFMYHHSSQDRSPAWKTKPLLQRYFSLLDLLKNTSDTGVCLLSPFSCVQLFVTLWAIAHQAPLSVGLSRQEHWSGLPCPPPRDWGGFYSPQAVSSDKGLCHLWGPST